MKKEFIIHFSFLISFFIFITLVRGWFSVNYLSFWLGGLLGTLVIDVDHLIYVYFLKPHELTSQRVDSLLKKRQVKKTFELLTVTRSERTELIFHTVYFQIIFLLFAFLVVTSSGSILGRGLVLAASLHLLIDQVIDYFETGDIRNWFKDLPIKLDKKQTSWYMVLVGLVILVFSFFF